jgi:quinohemoprotein ethanol dehydrogenase
VISYNHDYAETRFNPLKQIDYKNVGRLGLEKLVDVQGHGGTRQEATPLVWNGTMYLITTRSVVFAVDLRSGKEIWCWDPKLDMPNTHTCSDLFTLLAPTKTFERNAAGQNI